MGNATYNPKDWTAYANTTKTKSTSQIFTSAGLDASLDPRNITVRESCDSAANPLSTPIATFLDVTGSMGQHGDRDRQNWPWNDHAGSRGSQAGNGPSFPFWRVRGLAM